MNKPQPLISVTIICYKQEVLIKRAIDSIIRQKDFVCEIVICDDCSPDNTWQVVMDYKKQYPQLINCYRNPTNLGIFGNIRQTWKKVTGDIVLRMAGDDELTDGYLEKVSNYILEKHIDYKNEKFCIYGNFRKVYPNGFSKVVTTNRIIQKGFNPMSLKLRNLIYGRSCVFSRKIMDQFHDVPEISGMGNFVDGIYEIQLQEYTDNNYYINAIGNIYYARIGVSVQTNQEDLLNSYISGIKVFKQLYEWSEKDLYYMDFTIDHEIMRCHFSFKLLIHSLRLFFLSFEPRYGIQGLKLYEAMTLTYRILTNGLARI